MENLSRISQKKKTKKNYNSVQDFELLLLFTGCRKVLGKMPESQFIFKNAY